jgi:tetratricopeptide (TPR) repeat protein
MRRKKTIGFLVILIAVMAQPMGCGKKTTVQPQRFNKAATRDIIEGNTWYMKGCYHKALASFHRAYEKFIAGDDQDGVARALNNLGTLYRAEKDGEGALLFFDEARRIFTRTGDAKGVVQSLANTAATYTDMSAFDKAETALDEADRIAGENAVVLATLKSNRAVLYIRQKKTGEAKNLLTQALSMTSAEKPFEYATITHAMGLAMETAGDPETALSYYTKALETDRKAYYPRNVAADLSAIGRVQASLGKHDEALDALYRSLNIQTLVEDLEGAEKTSVLIKASLEALGDKKPDLRVKEHFLKRWSEGEKKAGICN